MVDDGSLQRQALDEVAKRHPELIAKSDPESLAQIRRLTEEIAQELRTEAEIVDLRRRQFAEQSAQLGQEARARRAEAAREHALQVRERLKWLWRIVGISGIAYAIVTFPLVIFFVVSDFILGSDGDPYYFSWYLYLALRFITALLATLAAISVFRKRFDPVPWLMVSAAGGIVLLFLNDLVEVGMSFAISWFTPGVGVFTALADDQGAIELLLAVENLTTTFLIVGCVLAFVARSKERPSKMPSPGS